MTFGEELQQGTALVVGASQGIGLGFVQQLLADDRISQVYGTYRSASMAPALKALAETHPKLTCLPGDATQESDVANWASTIQARHGELHLVVTCVGLLHEADLQPEKALRQANADQLLRYFQVNSIPTMLLAKQLQPLLKHGDRSVFATLSAKVGSIGDNRLGGWYGYRASKAALNMFLKTIAIEYSRRNPNTIVVALHPGTTDTRLSQPFQRNVPPEKLFSVSRTVDQLISVIDGLGAADSGGFFSWDGSPLPW